MLPRDRLWADLRRDARARTACLGAADTWPLTVSTEGAQAMADEQERDASPACAGEDEADSPAPEQGSLTASSYEAEDVFENAEPWDPIETKMVVYSWAAAVLFLAIFSYLINKYVLP